MRQAEQLGREEGSLAQAARGEDRAERTRAALLDAAEAVFAASGYAAARLEDVAQRVGIRRASIGYYFRDKRELYDAVLTHLFAQALERYRVAESVDGTYAGRIEALLRIWFAFCREHPAVPRILMREVADANAEANPAVLRNLRPLIEAIVDLVVAGQAAGEFGPINPLAFVFSIAGAVNFLIAGPPALIPDLVGPVDGSDAFAAAEEIAVQMARQALGRAAQP